MGPGDPIEGPNGGRGPAAGEAAGEEEPARPHPIWAVMSSLVLLDFLLGVGAILAVPFGRGTIWIPHKGQALYVSHAVLGALLGLGALYLILRYGAAEERMVRLAARTGIAGVVLGAAGGLLTVSHPLRLVGMGIMLLGSLLAGIGYLMPVLEAHDRKERAELAARYQDGGGPAGF